MESHNSAAAKSNSTAPDTDTDTWAHIFDQSRKDSASGEVQATNNSVEEELKIDGVEKITDNMPGVIDSEVSSFQDDDSSTSLDAVDSVLVNVSITTEESGSPSAETRSGFDSNSGTIAVQFGNIDGPFGDRVQELKAGIRRKQEVAATSPVAIDPHVDPIRESGILSSNYIPYGSKRLKPSPREVPVKAEPVSDDSDSGEVRKKEEDQDGMDMVPHAADAFRRADSTIGSQDGHDDPRPVSVVLAGHLQRAQERRQREQRATPTPVVAGHMQRAQERRQRELAARLTNATANPNGMAELPLALTRGNAVVAMTAAEAATAGAIDRANGNIAAPLPLGGGAAGNNGRPGYPVADVFNPTSRNMPRIFVAALPNPIVDNTSADVWQPLPSDIKNRILHHVNDTLGNDYPIAFLQASRANGIVTQNNNIQAKFVRHGILAASPAVKKPRAMFIDHKMREFTNQVTFSHTQFYIADYSTFEKFRFAMSDSNNLNHITILHLGWEPKDPHACSVFTTIRSMASLQRLIFHNYKKAKTTSIDASNIVKCFKPMLFRLARLIENENGGRGVAIDAAQVSGAVMIVKAEGEGDATDAEIDHVERQVAVQVKEMLRVGGFSVLP